MAKPKKHYAGDGATTYLDTDLRVRRAEELLCELYSGTEIVRQLCEEFEVVERTAYSYLKIAYEHIASDAANDRGIRKARARATWQAQYRRCLAKGDMPAANYALDRLCKLDGLFAAERLEITATLSVDMQIRSLVGVLDERGIAALEVIQQQIESARTRGLLPGVTTGDEDEKPLDETPAPVPAKQRGRKQDRSHLRKKKPDVDA